MSNDDIRDLPDLSVATVRRENPEVESAMAALEAQVEDLRAEKASLESTIEQKDESIEELEQEAADVRTLLDQFRESQRADLVARIEAANEALGDDEQVDLASLTAGDDPASVDHLTTMAEMAERLAEKATSEPVSNRQNAPDLSAADVGGDADDRLAELADEMGMGDAYQKLQSDGFDKPEGFEVGGESEGATVSDLEALLADATNGGA